MESARTHWFDTGRRVAESSGDESEHADPRCHEGGHFGPVMKIVIPDDYQDTVGRLSCFSLLAGHDVVRYREPAAGLDQLVERLHPADVIVAIRERVNSGS